MKIKPMVVAVYMVALLGIAFHVYLTIYHTTAGSFSFKIVPLMNALPFLACIVMTRTLTKPVMPLCAGVILLAIDIYLFREYFGTSSGYRYMAIETLQIAVKLVVIIPIGCFLGYFIDKFINRNRVPGIE